MWPVNWINNYTNTLNNLAAAYENLQASERSLPLYQEAVRIWSQCYESDAESSVVGYSDSLNNLAITYKKFGCPAKTVPLYQKSVEIWYKAYESAQEKKSRLESLYAEQTKASNNLLTNMQSIITSDIEKALEGYASSLNDLAMTYVEQGRPTEALSLLEKALSIHLEGYESAPERWANDYANSLGNLARTLEDTQELSRALEIWQEAKEITVKTSRLPEDGGRETGR